MINTQPILKSTLYEKSVQVFDIFPTIQGEGPFAGTPATFIRLYGCNLQCPLCDTDYTSQKKPFNIKTVIAVTKPKGLVVITGGEPFRQFITPMAIELLRCGYRVQIETNGTLFLWNFPHEHCSIVCSPKTGKLSTRLIPFIGAYKYILHADEVDPEDGLPTKALGHRAYPRVARPPVGFEGPIFVQPIDVGNTLENKRHLQAAVTSCLRYGYQLSLQIHKIIGVE